MKKGLVITIIVTFVIIIFGVITSKIDYDRIINKKEPIFTIKIKDGAIGKITYIGIGYKAVVYFGVSINEPFDHNMGFKFGNWFIDDKLKENNSLNNKVNNNPTVKNTKQCLKTIDGVTVDFTIPSNWNYEEMGADSLGRDKFSINFYKDSSDRYATLHFYDKPLGVCGTGLTTRKITLNNEEEVGVGYYGNDWNFIILQYNTAFINNGLNHEESEEFLEIIKTINVQAIN